MKQNIKDNQPVKLALGEIGSKFNAKATTRRMILQKQSELKRQQKMAGKFKSINDVARQEREKQKQNVRQEKILRYLNATGRHLPYKRHGDETPQMPSIGNSLRFSSVDQGSVVQMLPGKLPNPQDMHFNEINMSNYKFFGARHLKFDVHEQSLERPDVLQIQLNQQSAEGSLFDA